MATAGEAALKGVKLFEDIKRKIDKCIEYSINGIVNHAVDILVNNSPVWTGNYVENHIAEETAKGYPRAVTATSPPYPPHGDEFIVKASARIKLKSTASGIMRRSGFVAINNKAKHANFVEYLGWIPSGGLTPGYFPFGQTKESAQLNEQRILSKAKHKAFKR